MGHRWRFWTVTSVLVVVLGCLLYWVLDSSRLNGNALTAVGTLGAAVFTAVAAVAAFSAARQSDITSRNAMEALGLAMEPTLDAYVGLVSLQEGDAPMREIAQVEVRNKSAWSADDVEVEVLLSDGRRGSHRWARIVPASVSNLTYPVSPTTETFEITGGFPKHREPVDGEELTFTNTVTLRYSDERRALRWELVTEQIETAARRGATSSGGSEVRHTLRRVR